MANKGYRNSPVIGDNGLQLDPGDNTKFLTVSMKVASLPKIDMRDPEAVGARLREYFTIYAENDMKPTVAGMAMAFSWSRQQLWAVAHDKPTGGGGSYSKLPKESADVIKKAYQIMENMWENYMSNGKINPVSGIFLGKNNFGYVDRQEMVPVAPSDSTGNYDPEQIKRLYETNPIDAEATTMTDDHE